MARNDIAAAMGAVIDYKISLINTAIPGVITKYDAGTKKAEVKPLIKETFWNGEVLSMPVIVNTPVIFPATQRGGIIFDLQAGDTVLIIFSQKSMERWLASGKEVEEGVARHFDLTDGIAIPGLYSFASQNPFPGDDVTVYSNKGRFVINKDDKVAIGNESAELLDIIDQLISAIMAAEYGVYPLANPAPFQVLQQLLATIKGTL